MLKLIALSGLLLLGACASVDQGPRVTAQGPFMPAGITVDAPVGYADMCRRDASLCDDAAIAAAAPAQAQAPVMTPAADRADEAQPKMTLASWSPETPLAAQPLAQTQPSLDDTQRTALLNQVNRMVNGAVAQRTDMQSFGVEELWRPSGVGPGATGDCKDIAIEKRIQLIQHGFPARDLFYAVGFRADIGLHAVLIARTGAGDVVLDSRTPYIVGWGEAPYLWVKRQSRTDPALWTLVGGPQPATQGVNVAALDSAPATPLAR